MEVLLPEHIVLLEPVLAAGSGLTLTVTLLVLEQPVVVIVSVRV